MRAAAVQSAGIIFSNMVYPRPATQGTVALDFPLLAENQMLSNRFYEKNEEDIGNKKTK
jgi:hypothetical protein